MISSDKEIMLAGIRQALQRTALPGVPEPLPHFSSVEASPPEGVGSVVDRFRLELEQVGGRVKSVETEDEMKGYLEELLPSDVAATVAVSDGKAARDAGLRAWLTTRNVNVVPTLPEFMSAEQGSEQSSADAGTHNTPSRPAEQYVRALLQASIGITSADYAIADTGTLVLVAGEEHHRLISLLPPVHVCLLNPRRIVANMAELLTRVPQGPHPNDGPPHAVTLITGPSCTADIEQTLTKGMHGPRELHVLLYSPGVPS